MKKLVSIALMSVLTLNVFSQSIITVVVENVDPNCPIISLTGTYYTTDSTLTGTLPNSSFTSSSDNVWSSSIPSPASDSNMFVTICAMSCMGVTQCNNAAFFAGWENTYYITMPSFNDMDGDGYSASGGSDCNDNNPFIYPGAYEICDGLDNNCDGVFDTQPTISIYFIPESMVIEPNETYVVCQTTGATFWGWDFGNGYADTSLYTTTNYGSTGTYTFCLFATSPEGCLTDSCLTFTIDSTGWSPSSEYTLHIVPDYTVGIEELSTSKKLIRVLDETGRDAVPTPNRLFIYVYSDGSRQKKMIIE